MPRLRLSFFSNTISVREVQFLNAESPICLIYFVKTSFSIEAQPLNVFAGISIVDAIIEKSADLSAAQFLNAPAPIDLRVSEKSKAASDLQPLNAFAPIVSITPPVTDLSAAQSSKQLAGISVNSAGSTISSSEAQLINAPFSMVLTLSGRTIFFAEAFLNAYACIFTTGSFSISAGIVIVSALGSQSVIITFSPSTT